MTTPTPRKRRWPKVLIVIGLLFVLAGGVTFVAEASNRDTCTGATSAAIIGSACVRDSTAYAAGHAVFDIGLAVFLAGIIGSATDHARQRWRG